MAVLITEENHFKIEVACFSAPKRKSYFRKIMNKKAVLSIHISNRNQPTFFNYKTAS